MGFEDSIRLPVANLNNHNGHQPMSFNPFADDEPSFTSSHWQGFTKPALRRRTSDSSLRKSDEPTIRRRNCHSRSRTELGGHHHPLRSAPLNSGEEPGVTRPQLERLISVFDETTSSQGDGDSLVDEQEEEAEGGEFETKDTGGERVVLVHEISPKDSFAGVALKYGITVAELRKTNHLWSTDSIHLRKILYIPLSNATTPQGDSSGRSSPTNNQNTNTLSTTIRRIPASQLSYFPPPSKPLPYPSETPIKPMPQISRHIRSTTSPSPSSPPTPTLTVSSILSSLPITASARDTIIARLSFESSSNTSTSEEEDHELADVKSRTKFHEQHIRPRTASRTTLTPHVPSPLERATLARMSWTPLEAPQAQVTHVRTVQMEPSPTMQLPRTRTVPKSTGGDENE